jgi:hypothetical protein
MNNFERHEDPLKAMGVGIEAALKLNGITLDRAASGEMMFQKQPRGQLYAQSWSSEELRRIADYIEVHPECKEIIEDPILYPRGKTWILANTWIK